MATIQVYVTAGADDFQWDEDWTGFVANGDPMYVGDYSGKKRNVAFVFRSVAIHQGATVTAATLQMRSEGTNPGTTGRGWTIYGKAADDIGTISNLTDFDALTDTTNSDGWTPAAWTGGNTYTSPSIVDIISEIVARPGWVSGNDMCIIMYAWQSRDGYGIITSYDGDPNHACRLNVTFNDPTSSSSVSVSASASQSPSSSPSVSRSASPSASLSPSASPSSSPSAGSASASISLSPSSTPSASPSASPSAGDQGLSAAITQTFTGYAVGSLSTGGGTAGSASGSSTQTFTGYAVGSLATTQPPGGGGLPVTPPDIELGTPSIVTCLLYAPIIEVRLYSPTGVFLGIVDDFISLHANTRLNDQGNWSMVLPGDSPHVSDFTTDAVIQVMRALPEIGIGAYTEYVGIVRDQERTWSDKNERLITVSGFDPMEILSRRVIAYNEGTIRAEKSGPADIAAWEFVNENIGPEAVTTTVVGRPVDGYAGDYFILIPPDGTGALIPVDEPVVQSFVNLLTALQEMAATYGIDFEVTMDEGNPAHYVFYVYPNGMGRALNIVLSVPAGTVQDAQYQYRRGDELTVMLVQGPGESSTRENSYVEDADRKDDSPLNHREGVMSSSAEFQYLRDAEGRQALDEAGIKETFTFTPLQTHTSTFGVHFKVGDSVICEYDEFAARRKVVAAERQWDADGETISLDVENP